MKLFRQIQISNTSCRDLLWLLGGALLWVMPLFYLTDVPQNDVINRYLPMAELIARGELVAAMHPRVPPLLPLFGGAIDFLTGCSPFTALKLASLLFWLLTFPPLYGIFRRCWGRTVAIVGCACFLFCSQLLRLAVSGLRETGKGLFFILASYALLAMLQEKQAKWRHDLLLGGAMAGMILIREDCVLYAALFWLAALVLRRKTWWRTFATATVALLILSPWLWFNAQVSGYPVPGVRTAHLAFVALGPSEQQQQQAREELATAPVPPIISPAPQNQQAASLVPKKQSKTILFGIDFSQKHLLNYQRNFLDGIYWPFALPALLVIVFRIRARRWTREEGWILAVWVLHTVLIMGQILYFDRKLYLSGRYLLPAAPLLFGWTALALLNLRRYWLARGGSHAVVRTAAALMILGLAADTYSREIKSRAIPERRERRNISQKIAEAIRLNYRGSDFDPPTEPDKLHYRSPKRPSILSDDYPEIGYFANGRYFDDAAEESNRPDYLVLPPETPPPSGYLILPAKGIGDKKIRLYRLIP